MVTVFNIFFCVVPRTTAGTHGNGDKQARNDGTHQQAAERRAAAQPDGPGFAAGIRRAGRHPEALRGG